MELTELTTLTVTDAWLHTWILYPLTQISYEIRKTLSQERSFVHRLTRILKRRRLFKTMIAHVVRVIHHKICKS
ncbi:hypothetical protein LINGRAHAP2_LOCUS5941 [Linum grandiflorum]